MALYSLGCDKAEPVAVGEGVAMSVPTHTELEDGEKERRRWGLCWDKKWDHALASIATCSKRHGLAPLSSPTTSHLAPPQHCRSAPSSSCHRMLCTRFFSVLRLIEAALGRTLTSWAKVRAKIRLGGPQELQHTFTAHRDVPEHS